jgi:hypothetical protein
MRERSLGVRVQSVHAPLQKGPRVQVIMRRPLKKLTTREPDQVVVIRYHANIVRLSDVPNARVLASVATANGLGAVRRRVVGDDEFEVLKGLAKQCIEGRGQESLTVVNG